MFVKTNWSPTDFATAGLLDEAELLLEDRGIVVIEADDHARHHLDAGGLDAVDRRDNVRPRVLRLFVSSKLAVRGDSMPTKSTTK